jgi:hypothetical protein
MKRIFAAGVFLAFPFLVHLVLAGDEPPANAKEALQALQDYIGGWTGSGSADRDRTSIWKESTNWSWRFKGKEAWLTLSFPASKFFKSGEMRYLMDKNVYQLALVDKKDQKQVFQGQLKKGQLILERRDPDTRDTQQLKMNIAGGGIRSVYTFSLKPENRTLYSKQWQVSFTREGESFGVATDKKIECVVTGGAGTMPVSYNGVTYYVCCSGCRDAFNENPERIIKEYLARKKKSK